MKNFVVYKSGAGSGKTFTLVKEYLRLALHDEKKLRHNYRRILAITFTNKAAAEMKSRVVSALDALAHEDQLSVTGNILCAELNINATEIRKRATVVLSHLLHHYSDFAVGTIDSFTHKIVRTFAQELNLPVNFNVELDAAGFYEKVIAQLLAKVGEDEQVSRLLREYVLTKAEDNAFWDPEQSMKEFASLLLKENAGEYLSQLSGFTAEELEAFHRQFKEFIRHYRGELRTKGGQALALISSKGLNDDDFIYKKTGPQSFFRKCAAGEASVEDTAGSRLTNAVEQDKWSGKGGAEQAVNAIAPQLSALARELIIFIGENYPYYSLCELLSKQMYGLMLLRKIEEISQQQKEEERIVFISEFNNKIFNLISEEPAPFIYERLGERYQHFLLDEFQDTSSLQWQNLLPLLDNALANGWYNLLVGDGKQSIYRWRNANVRQFAALPEIGISKSGAIQQERAQTLKRNFEQRVLDTNYRSTGTIVNFNNGLFNHLKELVSGGDLSAIYAEHSQNANNTNEGYVTISQASLPADELEELNLSLTETYIRNAIEDGYEYSDICILCRKNLHGNVVATYLVDHKIPVVSSDSLLLKNNLEVNTILCYLRSLVNPRDNVSSAAVISYLYQQKRISAETFDLSLKKISEGRELVTVLKEADILLKTQDRLNNLADHCLNVIRALDLQRDAHQYIRFFLDEVNEFLVMKNPNIGAFLEFWENRKEKASLIIPDTTNAVKIMTIHASKGLEFPVVILPYCNWAVSRSTQTWVEVKHKDIGLPVGVISLGKKAGESGFAAETEQEQQEQVLDNLNLLYVAFTRAIDRMHLICARSKGQNATLVTHWINDYLTTMPSGSAEFYEEGRRQKKEKGKVQHQKEMYTLLPLVFSTSEQVVKIKNTATVLSSAKGQHARQHGLLVHALLSRVGQKKDIEAVIDAALTEGLFPAEEANDLKNQLTSLVEKPALREYFLEEHKYRSEAELLTDIGEVLRPDRVVFTTREAVIIDYKTGAENTAKYLAQLNSYEKALRDMGHKNVKKLLVYIDTDNVVEVK